MGKDHEHRWTARHDPDSEHTAGEETPSTAPGGPDWPPPAAEAGAAFSNETSEAAWARFAPPDDDIWRDISDTPKGARPARIALNVAITCLVVALVARIVLLAPVVTLQRRFADVDGLAGLDDDIDSYLVLGVAALATTVLAGIAVMIWLYRTYRTIDVTLRPRRHRPFMAIVGWFIPLANMIIPARVLCDLARGHSTAARRVRLFVVLWAIGFWGGWFLDRVSTAMVESSETIDEVRTAVTVGIVAMAMQLLAGALFLAVMVAIGRQLDINPPRPTSKHASPTAATPTAVRPATVEPTARATTAAAGQAPPRRSWLPASPSGNALCSVGVIGAAIVVAVAVGVIRYVPSGEPTTAGNAGDGNGVLVGNIEVGMCIPDLNRQSTDDTLFALDTVACEEPHDGEVYSVQSLGELGSAWPGATVVSGLSKQKCSDSFETYVGMPFVDTPFDIFWLEPQRLSWAVDQQVACMVLLPHPTRGSVAGIDLTGGWEGVQMSHRLDPGQCAAPGDELAGVVSLVDCAKSHGYEAIGSHHLTDGAFPGSKAMQRMAETMCHQTFRRYVGISYSRSVLRMQHTTPNELSWRAGHRTVACFIHADGATGSAKGTKR